MKTQPSSMLALILAITTLGGSPSILASNTLPTNPAGFAYSNTVSSAAISPYAHPTGMLITGRCNRYDPLFASARAAGAEILAYLNPISRPDTPLCALDNEYYMGDPGVVPLWPFPSYGQRVNFAGTHMTDVQVGSAWIDHVVEYVEDLMTEDKLDGVFLDGTGARTWGLSDWENWPQAEKDDWAEGMIDLVRRLDASRRAINPAFIIVTNGVWDRHAGDSGPEAEQYIDGVCLEHFEHTRPYHSAYANHPFGNLGHRRVIAIGTSTADAQAWAADIQGITHVSDAPLGPGAYATPTAPPVGFNRLTDRPKSFGRTTVGSIPSAGLAADYKRASKFVLDEDGTLLTLNAYLDGAGGASGEQSVRLVVYRDNGGVPGAKITESSNRFFAAGVSPGWRTFTVPNVALDAGTYWIAIHTGATGQLLRDYGGDGPASDWYGNSDAFFGGAADPFGTGTVGAGTLSVYATYTVGQ